MIERENAGNVAGQFELEDLIQDTGNRNSEQGTAEGYDAEGHLINPVQKPSPMGKVDPAKPETDEVASIATSAEMPADVSARLDVLAGEINAITRHARVVLASAAVEVGKRLIEARNLVPRGRWTAWLSANVDYSERKAQQLMQLAEEFGERELPGSYAALGLSQMTELLAAPAGDRDALAEKAVDEGLSVRQLRDEIAKLKAENTDQQTKMDALLEVSERKSAEIEEIGSRYDEAMERIREDGIMAENALRKEREAAQLAQARAAAAESSAEALRMLHQDAEDRAAQSAQRASDAVNRANQTAKDLAEARARIAELEREKEAAPEPEPVERIVEVVPEAVKNELADLRRQLAEAQKPAADTSSGAGAPPSPQGEGMGTAVARFRDSYKRLTEEFKTAEALIAEIVKDDAQTGHMYATAMVKSCRMMIERLGE